MRAGGRLRRIVKDHPGSGSWWCATAGSSAQLHRARQLPLRNGTAFTHETANTSMTEWRFTGHEWRLVRYNDAAYLLARSDQS